MKQLILSKLPNNERQNKNRGDERSENNGNRCTLRRGFLQIERTASKLANDDNDYEDCDSGYFKWKKNVF